MHQQEATADKRLAVQNALNKVNGLTQGLHEFDRLFGREQILVLGESGYRVVRRSS